jgi:arsenite-transporting ATPase
MARWYLEKIFPIEKRAVQLSRPLLRSITDLPIPEDALFDVIEQLIRDLGRMHTLLSDPEKSTVRLVLNPEKMVIKEAQRTYTYLNLYGYPVDAVISNRLIPEAVHDVYFDQWKAIQEKYSLTIEEAFSPLPILTVPLMDSEVVGLERLRQMGQLVYGDLDPAAILFTGARHYVKKGKGHYVLGLQLPFVSKEDLQLTRSGDELIVHIGNQKRNIVLPRVLVNLDVESAKMEDREVRVVFVPAEEAED